LTTNLLLHNNRNTEEFYSVTGTTTQKAITLEYFSGPSHISMAGHFRSLPAVAKSFPEGMPQFSGFMKPNRFEGAVDNLEIIGKIPAEIDGTFYRVMPDPHFPPIFNDDPVSVTSVFLLQKDQEG
jgi:hypothetical protein